MKVKKNVEQIQTWKIELTDQQVKDLFAALWIVMDSDLDAYPYEIPFEKTFKDRIDKIMHSVKSS